MLKKPHTLKPFEAFERTAIDRLQAILSLLPGFSEIMPPATGPDFHLRLSGHRSNAVLFVEVKARLWPSEVRSVARNLLAHRRSENGSVHVPVIIAPSVSQRAAEECRELGLNWADLAGNCHIQFGEVLVHIEGKPNVHAEKRGTSSLFTPRSSRVVHAILLEPLKSWRVADLAARTNISIGQVSNVRRLLMQNAFAESHDEGLRVVDPMRLLAEWSKNYKPRRTATHYYSLKRPGELEISLHHHLPSYALTEMAAAERYAPYTRYQNVSFYTKEWGPSYVKVLDLRPAENSANVAVYEDADAMLFSEVLGSATCSSPIITYLDLVLLGGRGQDAADHLLETTLLPRWK